MNAQTKYDRFILGDNHPHHAQTTKGDPHANKGQKPKKSRKVGLVDKKVRKIANRVIKTNKR